MDRLTTDYLGSFGDGSGHFCWLPVTAAVLVAFSWIVGLNCSVRLVEYTSYMAFFTLVHSSCFYSPFDLVLDKHYFAFDILVSEAAAIWAMTEGHQVFLLFFLLMNMHIKERLTVTALQSAVRA